MVKLKILLVLQYPWCDTLGTSKIHFDLKKEYERMGQQVDTLSMDDLYPNGQSFFSRMFALYTKKILRYLKKNAFKYDVIDSNFTCIPFPKKAFGFSGHLLFRSHGLPPLYREYEQTPVFKKILDERKQNIRLKTKIGNICRAVQRKIETKALYASIEHADIVHCLNTAEHEFLLNYGIPKERLLLVPNGLADQYISEANKLPVENKENIISFIGSWTFRKGITDLDGILNVIRSKSEVEKLQLLGGDQNENIVEKEFETYNKPIISVTPHYKQEQLLSLIGNTKVGILPSYVEGFGLTMVEQLACGIPVVAYKVPGPTDILSEVDPSLLIEPGEVVKFGEKVAEVLNMPDADYQKLAMRCKLRSKDFCLSKIASQFIDVYKRDVNYPNNI